MKKKWNILLSDLDYNEDELKAVSQVLDSRWLTMSERVEEFEQHIRTAFGINEVVMVNSGTSALHLALRACGCSPHDEVIVPALSFVATANVVLYCQATPVFADICSLQEPTISPQAIQRLITERTRAVIVMHYAGFSCQMAEIMDVIKHAEQKYSRKIWLIEDSAHAIGGKYTNEQWLGCIGDIGCFSFFSNKNLPTGEGGMLVTNNPEIAHTARLLRSHALTRSTIQHHYYGQTDYDVIELGYNYRPTEITAALALSQLKKLNHNNQYRAELTAYYRQLLQHHPDLLIPFPQPNKTGTPAFHIFPVLFPDEKTAKGVRDFLHKQGIQTSHHYRPIPDFTYYKKRFGDQSQDLPITYEYSRRELTLPLHPLLSKEDVACVVQTITEALSKTK